MKLIIQANYEAVSDAVRQMDEQLQHMRISQDERIQSILTLEEILVQMVDASDTEECISVQLRKSYRKVYFRLSARGEQVKTPAAMSDMDAIYQEYGPEGEEMIRNLIISQSQDRIAYKYSGRLNTIRITVHRNDKAAIYDTLMAIALAIISAIGLRCALPADMVQTVADNVFSPIYTLFMRAIMMILAPMIFFSLASCIANITDLSSLGRTSVKILSCYMLTTCLAIGVALGMYYLLQPAAGAHFTLPQAIGDVHLEETSILNTIINIVPDSFVGAFAINDILQILFLGIFVGIAVGATGQYSAPLRKGIEAINSLTQTILMYIVGVMPIAVFGAVGAMACTLDISAILLLGKYVGSILLTFVVMQGVYMLLIRIFGGINPIRFVREFLRVQLAALSTGSSCATMPVSMQACRNLGISPRIFNFSIPLGSAINMDGTSVSFTISGLFLATVYGIPVDASAMTSFLITVVLLSVAAPPVPGAGIACLLIILNSLGVPLEAATLIVGVTPFFDIADTVNNVVGDGTVTLIVAKSENQLDLDQYNS